MKAINALVALCFLVIVTSHITEAAVSCTEVEKNLQPCVAHLQSGQGAQAQPPAPCCTGIKNVSAMSQSSGDRKGVCECMKNLATKVSGINFDLANQLPNKCGVTMSFTINPNTDCSKV